MKYFEFFFKYDAFNLYFFKKIIYSAVIFYFISQINSFSKLYLDDVLHSSIACSSNILSILSCNPTSVLVYSSFFLFLILGVLNLIRDNFLSRLLFWILMINFFNLNLYILDGGNNLISLIAFFLIFSFSSEEINFFKKLSWFFNDLTGVSVFAVKAQIILLYFVTGVAKASSASWQNGTALYYTLTNPEYSIPFIINHVGKLPIPLLVIPAYFLILFQIFLGPLLFSTNTRKLGLFLLFIFHLFIYLVMGLGYFSMFMIASHFIFYDRIYLIKIYKFFKRKAKTVNSIFWSFYAKKSI